MRHLWVYFLVILPLLGRYEKGRALPASISEAVLQKKGGKHAMIAVLFAGVLALSAPAAQAADGHGTAPIPQQAWTFEGPFGTFDKASLQRGYKVYREVCAACHSMKKIYFRNLEDLGYNASQIKNIAKEYSYEDGPNEEGDMFERPGLPSDPFKSPFANDNAARYANGGALPPDLSLITKARGDGSNYIAALLTGYEEPPHGETLAQGQYWNKYFSGHKIGMAPPLSTDLVAYEDGTPQTVEQYARDVAHFLTWAAEPHMEARKQTGFKVIIFLLVFAGIMYGVKRKIWSHLH